MIDVKIGQMVLYTTQEADYPDSKKTFAGRTIAAMVVKVWDENTGTANLTCFPDGSNDGFLDYNSAIPQSKLVWGRSSALYDSTGAPGTWRFEGRLDVEDSTDGPTLDDPAMVE